MSDEGGWRLPGGQDPDDREPGFARVGGQFGGAMVAQFQAWPRLAENYCLAANGDAEMVAVEVEKATRNMNRARVDAVYALAQAEMIARSLPRERWGVVPSVAEIRKAWALEETGAPSPRPAPYLDTPETVEARREAARKAAATSAPGVVG